MSFVYDGRTIATYGEIGAEMLRISNLPDAEARREADLFMLAYRAETAYADQNVGYITGYYGTATMQRMLSLFGTRHPVFGGPSEAAQVTPESALAAGMALGRSVAPVAPLKSGTES